MTKEIFRELPWRSAVTWIACLAVAGFLALGLRALLAPIGAAGSFGVPPPAGDGLAYVQAFGARNIGLALAGLALIVLDQRRSLAVLFLAGALIAGLDFSIVATHAGATQALKHLAYVAGLLGFGLWLMLRR